MRRSALATVSRVDSLAASAASATSAVLAVLAGLRVAWGRRAALGFVGKTDVLSPGSVSERFRTMDRRVFAPLCAALSVGSALAFRG